MLTDTACRKTICPADKLRLRLADSGGLYLQIEPSGSRRWFWKYRFEGKEKRLALGSYPEVSWHPPLWLRPGRGILSFGARA